MNSNSKIYIVENFYENPNKIRYIALQQGLYNHGYQPGMRTLPCFNEEAHDKIVKTVGSFIYPSGDCYSFQFNTQNDVSWIHTDTCPNEIIKNNDDRSFWAAVVYLTPNAPVQAGTTIYSDKKYNARNMKNIIFNNSHSRSKSEQIIEELSTYSSDMTKWHSETKIGNKYNRLVIYDASYYHQSSGYFGDSKENCRLLQVFFFSTKKNDNTNKPAIKYRINEFINHQNPITISNSRGFLNKLKIED